MSPRLPLAVQQAGPRAVPRPLALDRPVGVAVDEVPVHLHQPHHHAQEVRKVEAMQQRLRALGHGRLDEAGQLRVVGSSLIVDDAAQHLLELRKEYEARRADTKPLEDIAKTVDLLLAQIQVRDCTPVLPEEVPVGVVAQQAHRPQQVPEGHLPPDTAVGLADHDLQPLERSGLRLAPVALDDTDQVVPADDGRLVYIARAESSLELSHLLV
eukprot:UN1275